MKTFNVIPRRYVIINVIANANDSYSGPTTLLDELAEPTVLAVVVAVKPPFYIYTYHYIVPTNRRGNIQYIRRN